MVFWAVLAVASSLQAEGPGGLLAALQARAARAPRVVRAQEKSRYAAPALDGVEAWFHWPARAPEGDLDALLSGEGAPKVALVDFFAYSCTNCIRTVPVLRMIREEFAPYVEIVGVHRPEFDFEHSAANLLPALADFGVDYPVGMDNAGACWRRWDVAAWPAHFVVAGVNGEARRLGDPKYGDRDHDELERQVRTLLCRKPEVQEAGFCAAGWEPRARNHERFHDAEFFFGAAHLKKNGDAGCSDACVLEERLTPAQHAALPDGSVVPLPGPGYAVYGTPTCPYCRRAKDLLQARGVGFAWHDVSLLDRATVFATLQEKTGGKELKTIPVIFLDGQLVGGFTDLRDALSEDEKVLQFKNAGLEAEAAATGAFTQTLESLDFGEGAVTLRLLSVASARRVYAVVAPEGAQDVLVQCGGGGDATVRLGRAGRVLLAEMGPDRAECTFRLRSTRLYTFFITDEPA